MIIVMVIRLSKERLAERYNNNNIIIPAAISADREQKISFSRELFCQRLRLQEYAARNTRLFSLRQYCLADKIKEGGDDEKKLKKHGTFS